MNSLGVFAFAGLNLLNSDSRGRKNTIFFTASLNGSCSKWCHFQTSAFILSACFNWDLTRDLLFCWAQTTWVLGWFNQDSFLSWQSEETSVLGSVYLVMWAVQNQFQPADLYRSPCLKSNMFDRKLDWLSHWLTTSQWDRSQLPVLPGNGTILAS